MKGKKLSAVISIILCFITAMNTTVFAVKTTPDSDVENISIFPMYGILEGQTRQMSATVDANGSFFDSVEWSSSNPNAISCTEDGKIKGLIAGESATITCKAKWGKVKDTIKVYCAEKIPSSVRCLTKKLYTTVYAQPSSGKWSGTVVSLPQIFAVLAQVFYLLGIPMNFSDALSFSPKLTVYGRIKNYAYVRYGESEIFDGFVKYSSLPIKVNGFFDLSADNMAVWANDITYANRKLTTTYNGDVKWDISNDDYISFDENTGQITGKTAGAGKKVTITARADGMTDTCIIHLLYKWPQAWTTKTNKSTYIYVAEGNEYKTNKYLSAGSVFVVQGDCGTSSGWAYGYHSVGETKFWGYIPIADVSTKGTVSQYNNLGWRWPVITPDNSAVANYISSPYGKRDTNPSMHKGMDITNGISSNENLDESIDGYEVVSAFAGKVVYVSTSSASSTGYCVGVKSNVKDPVSGEYYIAFYMHLKKIPVVTWNKTVSKGETLGYVGNTGNSYGSHLHFEANNKNASIGDGSTARDYYNYLINPLFFFTNSSNNYIIGTIIDKKDNDDKIIINKDSDAVAKYYGAYWYGND